MKFFTAIAFLLVQGVLAIPTHGESGHKKTCCNPHTEQCHECPKHSHWNFCGKGCPKKCCPDAEENCGTWCIPRCECDEGYLMSDSGKCVLPKDCPECCESKCCDEERELEIESENESEEEEEE